MSILEFETNNNMIMVGIVLQVTRDVWNKGKLVIMGSIYFFIKGLL